MRTCSLAILCLSFLLLTACGGSSTAQPYTNMHTVTAMSGKVAAHYGETSPKIGKVLATLTDGSTAVPMNIVALDGRFHKGNLLATHLSFSMLADGSKVWAIYATDDQYPTTHTDMWLDPEFDITP
jgi:hypothetical protein